MINNIRKYLRSEDDFKINQFGIGMKYLFRGFSIKVWTGTNFSIAENNKYVESNRIINKYCMEFYRLCWEDRNQKLHNKYE